LQHHPVVVIGAGLSGLTLAYRLLQKGIDVHVYEARQRVGGRLLTVKLNGVTVELGGQNLLDGGRAENIQRLIAELQLTTKRGKTRSRFHYYDGTGLINIDKVKHLSHLISERNRLRRFLKNIAEQSQNMSQVLHYLFASYPELYKLFAIRLMGYEGVSVERLSPYYVKTLESMLLNFESLQKKEESYFEYMVIQEGSAQLAEKLRQRLGYRINLGLPLKALFKTPKNSYQLIFGNGQVVEADRVVLALPCSVYQDIDFGSDEVLQSRLSHIKAVAYGEQSKILVPINNSGNLYGIYANDRFVTFSMATPHIVTMYYINHHTSFLPETVQNVFKRDQPFLELIYQDRAVSQLQAVYARCEHFVSYDEAVGYNWFCDPYSRGSYSCIEAGQEGTFTNVTDYRGEKVKNLFSPIDDRLFFVGEHTSILMDAIGTMEAAVEAGERTARIM
jgi:monoamine oxidase